MRKKFILVILLIFSVTAIFLVVRSRVSSVKSPKQNFADIGFLGEKLPPAECKAWYKELDNELKKANYCATDADCRTMELGGSLVEFGCYHFVNKNVDTAETYKQMLAYSHRCSDVIDDCSLSPLPKCENKKCVMAGGNK